LLSCLLSITGCADKAQQAGVDFTVTSSRNRDLVPENVILDVSNRENFPICISIAETRVGLGRIELIPNSGENLQNRPPAVMMAGFDISEGIFVLPSEKTRRIFVNIGSLGQSSHILKGTVGAAGCQDIFNGGATKIVERSFSQNL
jgi:hypothetical protein